MASTRRIGPTGTAARVVIGVAFVGYALSRGISVLDVAVALTALPALAVGTAATLDHVIDSPRKRRMARVGWSPAQVTAAGVVMIVVLGLGTALTFVSAVNGGALYVFVGLSMLLAAAKGYAGCEVLALPNLVLRRTDAIWCPLYTPVDALEGRARPTSTQLSKET